MEFLFKHRGAGKRQVKPSQDIAFLEDQIAAESSDDSEYRVDFDKSADSNDESNCDTDDSSSNSNENSDDDISDNEDGETPKDEVEALSKDDHENLTTKELLALARKELDHSDIPKWVGKVKICGCCSEMSEAGVVKCPRLV